MRIIAGGGHSSIWGGWLHSAVWGASCMQCISRSLAGRGEYLVLSLFRPLLLLNCRVASGQTSPAAHARGGLDSGRELLVGSLGS